MVWGEQIEGGRVFQMVDAGRMETKSKICTRHTVHVG